MKIDEETRKLLHDVIHRAKADGLVERERREAVLWAKMAVPFGLRDILGRLKKAELNNIRKNLHIKGLSALKKEELIGELEKRIPHYASKGFRVFDEERYELANRICLEPGFAFYMLSALNTDKIEYLRGRGLIFSAIHNGARILTMPVEVMAAFKKADTPAYRKIVRRNTEWTSLIHGMLYYYGVLTLNQLLEMVEKLVGEKPHIPSFIEVLFDTADYNDEVKKDGRYFSHRRAINVKEIVTAQKTRSNLDYFPFTKDQLIQAGEPGYVDITPEFEDFLEFLMKNYNMTRDEARRIVRDCVYLIATSGDLLTLMKFLQEQLEFPSADFMQEVTGKIINLLNNTRMWVLKGHTPQELYPTDKSTLQALPAKRAVKAVDIKPQKIGRNAPCLCGSGKKYKKCCGRDM